MQKTLRATRAIELIRFLDAAPRQFDHITQFAQCQCLIMDIGETMPDLHDAYIRVTREIGETVKKAQAKMDRWIEDTPTADDGDKKVMLEAINKQLEDDKAEIIKKYQKIKEKYEDKQITVDLKKEDINASQRYFERHGIQFDEWQKAENMMEILRFYGLEAPSQPDTESTAVAKPVGKKKNK